MFVYIIKIEERQSLHFTRTVSVITRWSLSGVQLSFSVASVKKKLDISWTVNDQSIGMNRIRIT